MPSNFNWKDVIQHIIDIIAILIFIPVLDKFLPVFVYGLGEGFKFNAQLLIIPLGIVEFVWVFKIIYKLMTRQKQNADKLINRIKYINKIEKKEMPLNLKK